MEKILSLCIPTYNRAVQLQATLQSIAEQLDDHEILKAELEVVISDNFSSDNTLLVAQAYCEKYPSVFRYYRNLVNTQDYNFGYAIERATGLYSKLHNDSHPFRRGSVIWMTESLKPHIHDQNVVVFTNFHNFHGKENLSDLDGFIHRVSYWTTWISSFGIWIILIDTR